MCSKCKICAAKERRKESGAIFVKHNAVADVRILSSDRNIVVICL